MLREIFVDGYKSIDQATVELKEFVLFSGVNSAGKSSMIQSINYLLDLQRQIVGIKSEDTYSVIGRFADVRNSVKGNKEINFRMQEESLQGDTFYLNASCFVSDGQNIVQKEYPMTHDFRNYVEDYRVIYLSAERVGVQNTYELNIRNHSDIGNRGRYVYSYLSYFGQDELSELEFLCCPDEVGMSLNNQVNYWLDYLLGFQIQVNAVQDVDQVVVTYSNSKSNRYYRAANVGTGVTYISTLIIAALSCKQGDTLIVENPEIHLHPGAQSRLMEFMAFLCDRGLQVILETHSDHIYNGMRKCIKRNMLCREKIAAYYFELDDSMQTKIHHITFNNQGAEENHPYGMFDQFDDDLDELIGM